MTHGYWPAARICLCMKADRHEPASRAGIAFCCTGARQAGLPPAPRRSRGTETGPAPQPAARAAQDLTICSAGSTAEMAAADSPAYMAMARIWPVAAAPGGTP